MSKANLLITSVLTMSILSGCTLWQKEHQSRFEQPPSQYAGSDLRGEFINSPWWLLFGDEELNRIMDDVFQANLSIEQAMARLDQFRAMRTVASSSWFPSLSTGLSYQKSGDVANNQMSDMRLNPNDYNFRLNSAYEIDLFGRLAVGRSSATSDLLASEEDTKAVILLTSAYVARSYYRLIELRRQLDLVGKIIASYSDFLDLVMSRYERGVVSSQDVYQAQFNLSGARARKTQAETALAKAENALSILLGKYPGTGYAINETSFPKINGEILPGIPSDLIRRRPDVLAAYHRMKSTDSRWAAAVAGRLPRFSLTAQAGGSSNQLQEALDPETMIWNAISSLTLPLFAGGALKANADRAEAQFREQASNYKATVLNAFLEVENALVAEGNNVENVRELEKQVEAARNSLRISTDRYLQGVTTYLQVVTDQTSYFNASSSLIAARRQSIDARIELVTALGGGWMDEVFDELTEK